MFSQIYLIMEEKKKRKKLNKYRYFSTGLKNRDDFIRVCYIFRQMFKLSQSILSRCLFKDRTKSTRKPYPGHVFSRFFKPGVMNSRESRMIDSRKNQNGTPRYETRLYVYICVCVCVSMYDVCY